MQFVQGFVTLRAATFTIIEPSNSSTTTIRFTPPPWTCPLCALSGGSATVDLKVHRASPIVFCLFFFWHRHCSEPRWWNLAGVRQSDGSLRGDALRLLGGQS